jgi:hypothetical protein
MKSPYIERRGDGRIYGGIQVLRDETDFGVEVMRA